MRIRKGMTLIEVVLSMGIIGIIAIAVLTIFNTGLININKAGIRTQETLEIKEELDNAIINPANINSDPEENDPNVLLVPDKDIQVKLPGLTEKIIHGSILSSEKNGISIQTYIPD